MQQGRSPCFCRSKLPGEAQGEECPVADIERRAAACRQHLGHQLRRG
jgi:hypothetical protein